jgi:arylsulfatase
MERFDRLKKMKMIPENARLSPPSPNVNKFRGNPGGFDDIRSKIPLYRPWNTLSEKEKEELDLEMAVYAAMVDRMDQNIGRIMNKLEETGLSKNTIIIFLSDNGSCPYDSNKNFDFPPGDPRGFRTLCAAWANLGNTPFRYFKQYGHEGGTRTHCIVRWPGKIKPGTITNQTGHIIDFVPTLLEVAGIPYPESRNGKKTQPLDGKSLLPVWQGRQRPEPDFLISGWTERFRMYREKEWKIVNMNGEKWELYNLKKDPTEMYNLADKEPEVLLQLVNKYKANNFISPGIK